MLIFRTIGIVVTLLFLVCSLTPVSNVLGEALAVQPAIAPAQAIVVLGAGLTGPLLSDDSLRRVVYGIGLYKRGLAPLLVLSGPIDKQIPGPSEAEIRRELAVQMGVPADRVVTIENVDTTRDEARETALRLAPGGGGVLLVTGSSHIRRAMQVFQRAGVEVLAAPSDDWPRYATQPEQRIFLMRSILEQTAGLLYYRVFGYI